MAEGKKPSAKKKVPAHLSLEPSPPERGRPTWFVIFSWTCLQAGLLCRWQLMPACSSLPCTPDVKRQQDLSSPVWEMGCSEGGSISCHPVERVLLGTRLSVELWGPTVPPWLSLLPRVPWPWGILLVCGSIPKCGC